MSFYITLPSNGADLNSEFGRSINTQTDFFINLKKTLDLSLTEYEVALVEFIYPLNWTIKLCEIIISQNERIVTLFDIFCHDGDLFNNLCTIINFNIEKNLLITSSINSKKIVWFEMNKEKNVIIIHVQNGFTLQINGILTRYLKNKLTLPESSLVDNEINLSDSFNELLQFDRENFIVQDETLLLIGNSLFMSEFFIDKPRIFSTQELFIYTDIIEEQYVGEDMVKLLKIFTVKETDLKIVSETVTLPHYLPVNKKRIDRIHMKISDSLGNKINFSNTHSSVVYKLHFRVKRF